jgi:hypothetical protein
VGEGSREEGFSVLRGEIARRRNDE